MLTLQIIGIMDNIWQQEEWLSGRYLWSVCGGSDKALFPGGCNSILFHLLPPLLFPFSSLSPFFTILILYSSSFLSTSPPHSLPSLFPISPPPHLLPSPAPYFPSLPSFPPFFSPILHSSPPHSDLPHLPNTLVHSLPSNSLPPFTLPPPSQTSSLWLSLYWQYDIVLGSLRWWENQRPLLISKRRDHLTPNWASGTVRSCMHGWRIKTQQNTSKKGIKL